MNGYLERQYFLSVHSNFHRCYERKPVFSVEKFAIQCDEGKYRSVCTAH